VLSESRGFTIADPSSEPDRNRLKVEATTAAKSLSKFDEHISDRFDLDSNPLEAETWMSLFVENH
jgi:hypothetical protein